MPDRKRGEGGTYTEKIRDRHIMAVFDEECDTFPCSLSSTVIHDGLDSYFDIDVSRETVRRRLSALEDTGALESERDGSKVIYWRLMNEPK